MIYSIGLLPIVVLPVVYALTFETQTLSAEDVERVRVMGRENRERTSLGNDASDRKLSE